MKLDLEVIEKLVDLADRTKGFGMLYLKFDQPEGQQLATIKHMLTCHILFEGIIQHYVHDVPFKNFCECLTKNLIINRMIQGLDKTEDPKQSLYQITDYYSAIFSSLELPVTWKSLTEEFGTIPTGIICAMCKTEVMHEEVMKIEDDDFHPECWHKKFFNK